MPEIEFKDSTNTLRVADGGSMYGNGLYVEMQDEYGNDVGSMCLNKEQTLKLIETAQKIVDSGWFDK